MGFFSAGHDCFDVEGAVQNFILHLKVLPSPQKFRYLITPDGRANRIVTITVHKTLPGNPVADPGYIFQYKRFWPF